MSDTWLESATDLLSGPASERTPFAVENLLVEQAIAMIVGKEKVGKTWLVLDLAVALATGGDALGRFAVERPGPVMLIVEESGRDALQRRLRKLCRGRGLDAASLGSLHVAANARVRLDDAGWRDRVIEAARSLQPAAVIFDPLVRVKGASVDENSQKEMARVLDFFRDLRDQTGATVVFTHHHGHRGKQGRGSSDLEGYWESRIEIGRVGEKVTISAAHREADDHGPYTYRLDIDDHSARLCVADAADTTREAEIDTLVRDHLHAQPDAGANATHKALIDAGHRFRRVDVLAAHKRHREAHQAPAPTNTPTALTSGSQRRGTTRNHPASDTPGVVPPDAPHRGPGTTSGAPVPTTPEPPPKESSPPSDLLSLFVLPEREA